MKAQLLFFITSAIALASASLVKKAGDPHDEIDWSQHPWQAPGENDQRGPCPGLNTLANHGFLPRSGSNITVNVVFQAIEDGFNIQRDGISFAAKLALLSSPRSTDEFNLNDLKLHSLIEHDGSISRADHALGDNAAFNETIFSVTANSNPGVDYYNATSAGLVFKERHEHSLANNPDITDTVKEFQIKIGEGAFYLSLMGNKTTMEAPKKFVNIFFREERLPLEEGWTRPGPISGEDLGKISAVVGEAFGWTPADPNRCPWLTLGPGASENPLVDGRIGPAPNRS